MDSQNDIRNAYSSILAIFQNKIEKGLPLSTEEKQLVIRVKSWSTKKPNLENLLKCFFDSDLRLDN